MSELITAHNSRTGLRWQLLATVSAVAMVAGFPSSAAAGGESRPTVWIEGGWHFDDITGTNDPFVPPLDDETRALGFPSSTVLQNTLAKAYGAEGSISFRPSHTDWVFSISGRYGRAHTARNIHQEKPIYGPLMKKTIQQDTFVNVPYTPVFTGYLQQNANNSESHAIVDFQVGKDLGIGLLGRGTETIVNFGARYAQFNSQSRVDSVAAPFASFVQITTPGILIHPKYRISSYFHASASHLERRSNFHAIGPSISMSNTTGLIGDPQGGQLALDWGANAAILFGRQRTRVSHQATSQQLNGLKYLGPIIAVPVTSTRSRSVVIPNLGGAAALSYRFTNAKLSVGYRADFFFGASDNGLDVRDIGTMGFHGPFATVSIGLGG